MQIEPIVLLPDELVETLYRRFGVDPDKFAAPAASVQTLMDSASRYRAEFEARSGNRQVGVPLMVHRRCAEPMFGISNAVAYAKQWDNPRPDVVITSVDFVYSADRRGVPVLLAITGANSK